MESLLRSNLYLFVFTLALSVIYIVSLLSKRFIIYTLYIP